MQYFNLYNFGPLKKAKLYGIILMLKESEGEKDICSTLF